jgi:hypothetical protein
MERSMQATELSGEIRTRLTLSLLWTFVLFNYVYADIGSFAYVMMHPAVFDQFQSRNFGSLRMTDEFMLAAAVFMEIPIAMVIVSWLAPRGWNRIANVAVGLLMTAVISFILATTIRSPAMAFYNLFQSIEIASTAIIAWIALRWRGGRIDHPAAT